MAKTKLTVSDFDCPVSFDDVNGKDCWVYLGNDLSECIRFAHKVRAAGEKFYDPLTEEIRSAHHQKMTKGMSLLLMAMQHYHDYNDMRTIAYPNEFPVVSPKAARGFTTHYNYLVQYGLLGKESTERVEGEGVDVVYWVTDLGREYLDGKAIPGGLYNIGSKFLAFDTEIDKVTIEDFFTVDELANMQKPLWFLPENLRQEILTPEELAMV